MLNWLRNKLGITNLKEENELLCKKVFILEGRLQSAENKMTLRESDLDFFEKLINNKLAELKEYTRVDADVGVRGNNTIILTGVMHGKGYVKFWDLGDGEFRAMADQLKHMQKSSLIRHIDEPPSFNFRGMFDLGKS